MNSQRNSVLYVSVKELCNLRALVNRSYATVRRWYKKDKTLPVPDEINSVTLGWKQSVIEEWLEENKRVGK